MIVLIFKPKKTKIADKSNLGFNSGYLVYPISYKLGQPFWRKSTTYIQATLLLRM